MKDARKDSPELSAIIDLFRFEFPGTKILHLKIGDLEYGEPTKPEDCVVPKFEPSTGAAAAKATVRKARTVGETRRSSTRYKEAET